MNKILLSLALVPALACAAPRAHEAAAPLEPHVVIQDDYDAALELARESGRPLLVNFSGRTCVNCQMMEREVFVRPAVSAALEPYVEARLHTDLHDEFMVMQREWTGSVAIPHYVVVNPVSLQHVATHAGPMLSDDTAFVAFLAGGEERMAPQR